MADDQTPPSNSHPISEAELHYKSLTDLFKFLVTLAAVFIGLFTTVGLYLGYKDMAAMRAEVRQNLLDAKADMRQNMSDIKANTKTVVDETKDNAKASIESAKNATDSQILQIRDRSSAIALSEAQRRVDEAFHNRNIEGMVENAASRQVAPVIERQLRAEVDRAMLSLQSDISFLGQLADAGSYLRGGGRPGLDKLIELQRVAPSENMRLRASSLLDAIGSDYEKFFAKERANGEADAVQQSLSLYANELKQFSESEKRAHLIPILVREIRRHDDVFEVTIFFLALRTLTNQPFRVFDIDAVDRWCKEHGGQCR